MSALEYAKARQARLHGGGLPRPGDHGLPGFGRCGGDGLDGLYRKGELTYHGFAGRPGVPRVNAVKGTWQDDHAFVIDRLVLGLGEPAERWTLTFDGEKLNVRGKIPDGPEISVDGETGE